MVCSLALTTVAIPTAAKADEYDQKIDQQNQKIDALKTKEAEAEAELTTIESDLLDTASKVDELTAKKETLTEEIATLYDEISDLNIRIQKRDEQMQKQARDVQVSGGGANYLDIVINAESISDAISRIQGINTLVKANNDLLEQQTKDKEDIQDKSDKVSKQIKELDAAKVELDEKTASLGTLKLQYEVAKSELEAQRSTEEGTKAQYVAQKEEAQKKLAEEQARQAAAAEQAKKEAEAAAIAAANTPDPIISNTTNTVETTGEVNPTTEVDTNDLSNNSGSTPTPTTPSTGGNSGGGTSIGSGSVSNAKKTAASAALADIGNSYPTGWNQPGECLVSVRRWLNAGGINFAFGGVHSGYTNSGATEVSWNNVQVGDVIQYESIYSPDAWIGGVHTVLVVGVNGGTVQIVEANNPGGSGYVSTTTGWAPAPPAGFRAVVWRFPG